MALEQETDQRTTGPYKVMRHDGTLFGYKGPFQKCCGNCSFLTFARYGKNVSGRLLDGREWTEMPELKP